MKQFCILFFFLLLSAQSFGQVNYNRFLEEGKTWIYNYHGLNDNVYNKSLTVAGDTLIGDKSYKKIVDVATSLCECAMREDEGKGYCSQNGNEFLVYDFSLNVGDTFKHQTVNATVVALTTVAVGGRSFRVLDVRDNENDFHPNWWIEGIGSMNYLTNSIRVPGDYYTFLQCQINDDILFSQENFLTLTVQRQTIENKAITPVYSFFDLQGRRLDSQPTRKGIYIQNGKKVVTR